VSRQSSTETVTRQASTDRSRYGPNAAYQSATIEKEQKPKKGSFKTRPKEDPHEYTYIAPPDPTSAPDRRPSYSTLSFNDTTTPRRDSDKPRVPYDILRFKGEDPSSPPKSGSYERAVLGGRETRTPSSASRTSAYDTMGPRTSSSLPKDAGYDDLQRDDEYHHLEGVGATTQPRNQASQEYATLQPATADQKRSAYASLAFDDFQAPADVGASWVFEGLSSLTAAVCVM
jgi:hypothetical protein